MLDAEFVRAQLWYDKKTGSLWWKTRASGRRMNLPAGTPENGYVAIGLKGKVYKAHRLAWLIVKGKWPKTEIDHKNTVRNDNRWKNLREASHGQNQCNSPRYKNNASGYKGVSWHPQHKKWYAQLQFDRKTIFIGLFTSKKKAHAAYRKAARKHFGEYARF